jgi:sulfur carrier protein
VSADLTVLATVNGQERRLDAATTVADLVGLLVPGGRGVAVAVDREVVPRSAWASTVLTDGAVVEIVSAAAGG